MLADEMRIGLHGQVRRVWCSRGKKVVQKLQFVFEWLYLVVAADPCTGHLKWRWIKRLDQVHLKPVIQAWALDAIIWDNASAHTGRDISTLTTIFINQPPYSPELNPIERLFEYLRDKIEGLIYPSLKAKQLAVERELKRLAAQPHKLRSLIGYDWILAVLEALPDP